MIAFAMPWMLGAAALAAVAVGVLHLLSVQRPPELVLPTTRFLPERPVRAVSRTRRPSDLLLLALRIACVLAAGLAAAGPSWRGSSTTLAHVVVIDRGVVHDTAAIRRLIGMGPLAFAFVDDNVVAQTQTASEGPASVWPVAWRAAALYTTAHADVDSIDLHVLVGRNIGSQDSANDSGWSAWASVWPGRTVVYRPASTARDDSLAANVHRVQVVVAPRAGPSADVIDDVVLASIRWHASRRSAGFVSVRSDATILTDTLLVIRSDRGLIAPPDDATNRNANTRDANTRDARSTLVRLLWPEHGVPTGWVAQSPNDSSSALVVGGQALVGSWVVAAQPLRTADVTATDIAWWSDGRVAARELRRSGVCEREVAVVLPTASDALLSASADALFDRLLSPCEERVPMTIGGLTGRDTIGRALAPAASFRDGRSSPVRSERGDVVQSWSFTASRSILVPVLLAAALILLAAEQVVRSRIGRADT